MSSGNGKDQQLTTALYKTGITIIDIRTKPEWQQTGIIKGSKTLTFFDEKGNYNATDFLNKLSRIVQKDEAFAIICRSGNRTTVVSKFLKESGYPRVINLLGGVKQAAKNGIKFEKYR
ncbi:MAG: rhodanese-like domain-containing protein [Denitrovibrio sp.]|nr:MAG: rhodanese-like domain-containing protein [Denitrovibrio sp.]